MMTLTGRCSLAVYYCVYCGYIHGGQAVGGVEKTCLGCGFQDDCYARKEVEDGELRAYEQVCPVCLLEILKTLIGEGNYAK